MSATGDNQLNNVPIAETIDTTVVINVGPGVVTEIEPTKPDEKQVEKPVEKPTVELDIVKDIADIIELAQTKLTILGDATFSADQYIAGIAKLKELRNVVDLFARLLERSNAALLDEKAQLMKRLGEIQRVMNSTTERIVSTPVVPVIPKKEESTSISWADKTEEDEKQNMQRGRQFDHPTRRRGNSPVDAFDSFSSMENPGDEPGSTKRPYNRNNRGRSGGRTSDRSVSRRDRDGDSNQDESPARVDARPKDAQRGTKKPARQQGSRIPAISASPLKRRVVMDDIEGFALIVKQDPKYGQLVTFGPPFDGIIIGGVLEIVQDRQSIGKPNVCEPLYLEGMCNCSTNTLILHAGKPLQIAVIDFVAILHKFVNNYSGNLFNPHDTARSHMDAIVLRCVIHAIIQIKGRGRSQIALTIGSFAEATDPKNLLNAISNFYHRRDDIDPMSVARGLFVALATHFVSS